eukprot:s65_g33.t1
MLPDHRLRQELQNAIGGTIFRRPVGPAFMEGISASQTVLPRQSGTERVQIQTSGRRSGDDRPEWLIELEAIFQKHAFVEMEEEGPVIYVLVWFLHGLHNPRCVEPRVARLHSTSFEWRTELVFVWRDSLRRGEPIDFVIVKPDPPRAPWQSHVAHILMTQEQPSGQIAAMLSATIQSPTEVFMDHVACFLPPSVSLMQMHNLVVPAVFRDRPTRTRRGSQILPPGTDISVQPGDSILFEILVSTNESADDHEDDATGLLQGPRAQAQRAEEPMEQAPDKALKIDLSLAIDAFEWLDAHFLLLDLVLPDKVNLPAECLEWMRLPIWEPSIGGDEFIIYFDGSFQPEEGAAGLAVAVFVRRGEIWFQGGFLSAALPSVGSYVAELQASIVAAKLVHDLLKLVSLVQVVKPTICFGFDSASVGNQLLGHWKSVQHPILGRCARMMIELLEARFEVVCQGWHIRSHKGEPGNELVDALANAAALGHATHDVSHFLDYVGRKSFVDAGEWAWILFDRQYADKWHDQFIQLPSKPTTTPKIALIPEPSSPCPQLDEFQCCIKLKMATGNVLTLKNSDKPQEHGMQGLSRQAAILKQFEDEGIHVFAMQETRLRKTPNSLSSNYLLLASPATESGHYGILMGFHSRAEHGYITRSNGQQNDVCFTMDQLSIVAKNPRVLIVRARTPVLKCLFIAAHAPHTGSTEAEIESWWRQLRCMIPAKYDQWDCVLLADANARVGSFPSESVGSWQCEEDTEKSAYFLEFVHQQSLWLPATFEAHQSGPGGTWLHNSGKWLRNDFIGIPTRWMCEKVQASVNENIDLSTVKEDHAVAMLEVKAAGTPLPHPHRHTRATVKRSESDLVPETGNWLLQPFNVDWQTDVHTHADIIQSHVLSCIPHRKKLRKPLKSTMSESTWALVKEKRFWRNQMWDCNQAQKTLWMRTCFESWKENCVQDHNFCRDISALNRQHDLLIATAYNQFRTLGLQVVKAMRHDDACFFDSLSRQAGELVAPHQAREFWQVMRRSIPKIRQRRQSDHPMRLEHLEDEWHPYFQELEVGSFVTPDELVAQCHEYQVNRVCDNTTWTLRDFPSRAQIVSAFRDAQPYKSTGLDPLRAGLLHRFPVQMAKICFELFLKVFAWQSEPIQGKGGILAVILKKQDQSRASNFRGIMLLPSVFKRLHALLREEVVRVIAPLKPAGQIGGFSGQQVQFGSMSLQCLSRLAKQHHLSMGIVFVDLANAFHRLIRELICGVAKPDDVMEVVESLVKAGGDPKGVKAWLELPCLLKRQICLCALTPLLQKHSVLYDITSHHLRFQYDLCVECLVDWNVAAHETLFRVGRKCEQMLILTSGQIGYCREVLSEKVSVSTGLSVSKVPAVGTLRTRSSHEGDFDVKLTSPGDWLCEACLWCPWNYLGRAISETRAAFLCLNYHKLLTAASRNKEACRELVVYARHFTESMQKIPEGCLAHLPVFRKSEEN